MVTRFVTRTRLGIRLPCYLSIHVIITLTLPVQNIKLLCIDYALRPRLSSRLTLGGRTWPGILGFTVARILIWLIATHVCILTNQRSTILYSLASQH